jgi:hypothetical protein
LPYLRFFSWQSAQRRRQHSRPQAMPTMPVQPLSGCSLLSPLLQRFLAKAKCENLTHTQSQVWTIPQTQMGRLKQQLRALGVKFALLRENWNHILRLDKRPRSRAQEEALAKARKSPETIGITVMRAPEAAVTEYALTGGADDATSRIIIPVTRIFIRAIAALLPQAILRYPKSSRLPQRISRR